MSRVFRVSPMLGDAAHVLWLVASFDAFDLIFTGRGLSAQQTGRILADTFENAVCT